MAGMTLNERLLHVGIIDQWDEAARRRDRDKMIELLERVDVREPYVADAVFADPQNYGF
ncbi:hypothetical protein NKJ52_03075 [Mesorhizobium australicum]|uniref:hypothetical protein n=1 Tax=Mesorhizobium australicum TaxID=536018 RepID=UPI0033361D87